MEEEWFNKEYPHIEVKGSEGEGSCNQSESHSNLGPETINNEGKEAAFKGREHAQALQSMDGNELKGQSEMASSTRPAREKRTSQRVGTKWEKDTYVDDPDELSLTEEEPSTPGSKVKETEENGVVSNKDSW